MAKLMRFGRRLSLPSTRQIRHELQEMIRADDRRKAVEAGGTEAALVPPPQDEPAILG